MHRPVDVQLGQLVNELASVAVGDSTWTVALQQLAGLTGARSAELLSLGSAPFHIITEVSTEELGLFAEVNGHDPKVNSRVRVGVNAREMEILDESHFQTEEDCRRNPAYGEVIQRLDIPFAHLCILEQSTDSLGLTLLTSRRGGAMSNRQKAIMAAAAPHIRNAVKIQRAFENRAMEMTVSGLDKVGVAAFVLDRNGRVRVWSSSADALLLQGDIRLKDGRLGLRNGPPDALAQAVDTACRAQAINDPAPTSVRAESADGVAYSLEIMPLPPRHGFAFEAGALVVARPPRRLESQVARLAAVLYGLTPAESAVTGMLAAGLSPQAIAERQGTAIGTVRTHIRRIFEKSGCGSQLELVSALLARV